MSRRSSLIEKWYDSLGARTNPRRTIRLLSKVLEDYDRSANRVRSTDKVFYTYVLLDPTQVGRLRSYYGKSGLSFKTKLAPFYVGKGSGSRVTAHMKVRKNTKAPLPKRVTAIKKLGLSYEYLLFENLTECEAFAHELDLILGIGRKDLGTGPLLNRSSGGFGAINHTTPQSVRELRSKRMSVAYASRSPAEHRAFAKRIKEGLERMLPQNVERKRLAGLKSTSIERNCPHCGTTGRGPNMLFYHMDNCPDNPNQPASARKAQLARAKAFSRVPMTTCPKCHKAGQDMGHFRRFHFERCIYT